MPEGHDPSKPLERKSLVIILNYDTGAPMLLPIGPASVELEIISREVKRGNGPWFAAGGWGL